MQINTETRATKGKSVRNLRKEGLVPAVAYGPTFKSQDISVNSKAIKAAFSSAGHNNLVDLNIDSKGVKALIKEVQIHPLTGDYFHVSFYVVNMNQEIDAQIPVRIEGIAPAVKNNIGFLEVSVNEVKVRCLPGDLPKEIVIDVSALNEVGDSILLENIDLGKGVKVMEIEGDFKLVVITPPQKIEEEVVDAPAEGEVAEGAEAAPAKSDTTE